jgi:hypothetical protein
MLLSKEILPWKVTTDVNYFTTHFQQKRLKSIASSSIKCKNKAKFTLLNVKSER